MTDIQARSISVSFNGKNVLDQVDLDLARGEIIGLIGPNGAGKSTLMKTLIRIIRPQGGEVLIKGRSIDQMGAKDIAKDVAYLPQGTPIQWPLAAKTVVSLGRIPHLMPWQKIQRRDEEIIERAMKTADVWDLKDRPIDRLAGGEKTLTMIARTLAVEPSFILADEPVSGLDPNHQIQIMQHLKSLSHQERGILVVLHDLSAAARFCDRLYLLHQGKMLASGKPVDVLTPDHLKQSYGIDARYGHFKDEFYVVPWNRLK